MQWYSKSQSGRKDFQDIYPYMSIYLYIIYIPDINPYNNTNYPLENVQNIWTLTSPKKTFRKQINIWENVQHSQSLEKCKLIITMTGTSLVVQWLRLCTFNAGGLGSISAQETRSQIPQLKILSATMKTKDPLG